MTLSRFEFLLFLGFVFSVMGQFTFSPNRLPADDYIRVIVINPALPAYTLRFIINPSLNKAGAAQTVSRIQITRADNPTIFQTLRGFTTYHPFASADFEAKDINFDGYLDLMLYYDGGSGGSYHHVWLFDLRTRKFNYSRELSQLSSLTPDSSSQTLRSISQNGACCGEESVYGFERGKLVRLSQQTMDERDNRQSFIRTIRLFRHEKLVSTRVDTLSSPDWIK